MNASVKASNSKLYKVKPNISTDGIQHTCLNHLNPLPGRNESRVTTQCYLNPTNINGDTLLKHELHPVGKRFNHGGVSGSGENPGQGLDVPHSKPPRPLHPARGQPCNPLEQ